MVTGIILAAGDSRRIGSPKALLRLRGKTFLEHVFGAMSAGGVEEIVVVVGRHEQEIRASAAGLDIKYAVNSNPADGMISSVRAGLSACGAGREAAMLALVDQPLVGARIFSTICKAWAEGGADIVIPRYNGKRGHPIVIGAKAWPLCFAGPLDKGLHWVTHHPDVRVRNLDIDDAAIVRDVDTPEDYAALTGEPNA